jgi:hypothetical protein
VRSNEAPNAHHKIQIRILHAARQFPSWLTFDVLQMKRIFVPLLTLSLLLCACQSTDDGLAPVSQIRPGVAPEGSLANAKLLADASNALFEQLQIPAIERLQTKILKFVIQQPVGPVGKKAWRESWVIMRAGGDGQFIVTFREDGAGSANFEFEGQKR